jgi:hypothetical protein
MRVINRILVFTDRLVVTKRAGRQAGQRGRFLDRVGVLGGCCSHNTCCKNFKYSKSTNYSQADERSLWLRVSCAPFSPARCIYSFNADQRYSLIIGSLLNGGTYATNLVAEKPGTGDAESHCWLLLGVVDKCMVG